MDRKQKQNVRRIENTNVRRIENKCC